MKSLQKMILVEFKLFLRQPMAAFFTLLFPMIFLSGAALPRQILPENIQRFGDWLPLTHVVNLIQDLWYGNGWNFGSLAVVIAVMLLAGLVATRTFRWE